MRPVERVLYFANSLWKRAISANMSCPNCGARVSETYDRKFMVVELRRCLDCRLLYRVPTDGPQENRSFYQSRYAEGFTTELPGEDELAKLKASGFAGTGKSYEYYVDVLKALGLGRGARVFDYGCSWGYGSWQLSQAGYQVTSYEISGSRAAFARQKLGVTCIDQMPDSNSTDALAHSFDVFFSAHVLEHVPYPGQALRIAEGLVKQGGFIVSFTPNASLSQRKHNPRGWHTCWGKVHPNMIDEEFYRQTLKRRQLLLAASPVAPEPLAAFARGVQVPSLSLIGDELACIARR